MNLRTPRIIWAAMLVVPFIYTGIGLQMEVAEPSNESSVLLAMLAAAAMAAVMSFAVPFIIFRAAALAKKFEVHEVPDSTDESMFRDMPKTIREFKAPEQVRSTIMGAWQPAFIISLAISESIAIYGFVLVFMNVGVPYWPPFMVVGALLIAIRFPTEARVLRPVERFYDARMPKH